MTSVDDSVKVDYYLTVEEIVNNLPILRCDDCGRVFQNASACRFHRLKQHLQLDVSNTNEKRLFHRSSKEKRIIQAFFCPDALCRSKKSWFDGLRNLKQHYFRAHTEKKLACEHCSFKCALEKDINYHIKARCPKLIKNMKEKEDEKSKKNGCKKRKDESKGKKDGKTKKSRRRKRSAESSDDEESDSSSSDSPESSPPAAPSSSKKKKKQPSEPTVVQPIFFIVNPENVNSVVGNIRKLLNPADISLNSIGREPEMQQDPLGFIEQEQIPIIETGPTSNSFATQYDPEPATFCERGTMMTEEPLSYFDPPYGEEFGDMTPRLKNTDFNYAIPSSSQQPQTRSFGTMFENVTTCNTGTSMIDESFDSEFLRDIETQTPSYMIQQQQQQDHSSTTTDDWWGMTDADI